MRRLDHNTYFMSIAIAVAARSTCQRRAVGCVIVDTKGRIMSTGYNGVPRGHEHCLDEPCLAVGMPSGEGLDLCRAIHAETNALAHCRDTLDIYAVYTTTFPCIHCMKQLSNTSMKELHYRHTYPSEDISYLGSIDMFHHTGDIFTDLEEIFDAQRQGSYSVGEREAMATSEVPTGTRGYKRSVPGY